jgi:ribosome maturation factor RimP
VLRSANDWRRFVGKQASVLTAGARAEFEVVGVDGEPGAEIVALREKRGEIRHVPLAEIEEARLVFRW